MVKEGLLTELARPGSSPPISSLTAVLVFLAILMWFSPLPEIDTDKEDAPVPGSQQKTAKTSVFQFPHLLLGVLCIFLYVGVEVMAGDAIGTYGKAQWSAAGCHKKYFGTYTLSCMLLGYIVGIFTIPKIISQQTGLKISAILGIVFSFGAFATHGYVAIAFIALFGLANALMWPRHLPTGNQRTGQNLQRRVRPC